MLEEINNVSKYMGILRRNLKEVLEVKNTAQMWKMFLMGSLVH